MGGSTPSFRLRYDRVALVVRLSPTAIGSTSMRQRHVEIASRGVLTTNVGGAVVQGHGERYQEPRDSYVIKYVVSWAPVAPEYQGDAGARPLITTSRVTSTG